MKNVVKKVTDYEFQEIVSLAVQDRGAIKVAEHLNLDEKEGCDIHDGNKVDSSDIGNIV